MSTSEDAPMKEVERLVNEFSKLAMDFGAERAQSNPNYVTPLHASWITKKYELLTYLRPRLALEGYEVVPVEPTKAMLEALFYTAEFDKEWRGDWHIDNDVDCWKAMVKAAKESQQ